LILPVAVLISIIGIYGANSLYQSYLETLPQDLCGHPLEKGTYTYYGAGGGAICPVSLKKESMVTGGFVTNASMLFYVMNEYQYSLTNPLDPIPKEYVSASINTTSDNLNITLPSGSYSIMFWYTYRITMLSPINGTGWGGATEINITQTFMATPLH
jgi:hypothetical protein